MVTKPSPVVGIKVLDTESVTCENIGEVAVVRPGAKNVRSVEYNCPGYKSSVSHLHGKRMYPDKVNLHIVWRETDRRIEELRARVREGVDVMAASEFARWLQFSGVLGLLSEQQSPLECRVAQLRDKMKDLIFECGDWFANHDRSNVKPHPQIPRTELERINAQLSELRDAISQLSPSSTLTPNSATPALRVIEGGVNV